MIRLIYADMERFLHVLHVIKQAFDAGSDRVTALFADWDEDWEPSEMNAVDTLYHAAEHVSEKQVYDRDADGNIDPYAEPMYDEWFFSSTEMTQYYRMLNQLFCAGKMTREQYLAKKKEMRQVILDWVLDFPSYQNGIFNAELRTRTNHKYASSLKVYTDYYNDFVDLFALACGIAVVFDTYKRKLEELKNQYGDKISYLEAA